MDTAKGLDDDMLAIVARAHQVIDDRGPPAPPRPVDVEAPELRRDRQRFDELMRWGLPYRETVLVIGEDHEPLRDTDALRAAQEFLGASSRRGGPNILVLAGPVGVGKTVAGVFVATEGNPPLLFGRRWPGDAHPAFHHVSELVALGLYERDGVRAQLAKARVVVLDDLGTEYHDKGGVFLSFLDWFLNQRYGSAGLTVITTNLAAEPFRAHYGERIYDRLRHRAAWRDIDHGSLRG